MSTALRVADRWFRAWGLAALLALAATAISLATGRGEWHVPFVLAHLAALLALLPLALVLLVDAVRDARRARGSLGGAALEAVRRHRTVALLLLVTAVAIAVSLANQETRALRTPANLVSVAVIVVLVVRYLRSGVTSRVAAR